MNNDIGKRIKHMRTVRSMTQRELAFKINATPTTISNYEVGYSNPDFHKLCDIAKVLEVDLSYFKDGNEECKKYQQAYENCRINFFKPNNASGMLTADEHLCDGYILLPLTNEFKNQHVFATSIQDRKMAKAGLDSGSLVIINCSEMPKNNTIAAVYIEVQKTVVIRRYVKDNGLITLMDDSFLSNDEIIQYYPEDITLIGTVVKSIIDVNK